MTKQLPTTPNIRYLRTQAKDFLTQCRSGNARAIDLVRSLHPESHNLPESEIVKSVRLCDAQAIIAREYGLADWSSLSARVNSARRSADECSIAMEDPRLENLDYRTQLAARKGLPALGTSRLSAHGVRYTVVDYMPAVSRESAARVLAGRSLANIEDLLPLIEFPDMSSRLKEFLLETDCATTKQMLFFDSMPMLHPATAAPGLNKVCSISDPTLLFFHFDAAEIHETIIAHELAHVWVEMVDGCEDYRQLREPAEYARSSQFQHIQSCIMDMRVNGLLATRGFDMSIISSHQAESIRNFAAHCARGDRPRYRRLLASVINTIAAALLDMDRFPAAWRAGLRDAFDMIRIGMPEAFEAALEFVASVNRHGCGDSAAVRRVVDECALVSFAVTGDCIDLENDLVEVPHTGILRDKYPAFLPQLPLSAKLDVFRSTAKLGITGCAKYELYISPTRHACVTVSDPAGLIGEPIRLSYQLPELPPNPYGHGAPNLSRSPGNAYIPPPGLLHPNPNLGIAQSHTPFSGYGFHPPNPPYSGPTSAPHPTGFGVHPMMNEQFPGANAIPQWGGAPTPHDGTNLPGIHPSVLDAAQYGAVLGVTATRIPPGWPQYPWSPPCVGHDQTTVERCTQFSPQLTPGAPAQFTGQPSRRQPGPSPTKHGIQAIQQQTYPEHFDIVYAIFAGTELVRRQAPPSIQQAALPSPPQHGDDIVTRNYMAGFGLWISRVGFEQQALGEHPYGYAMNNPVSHIDPSGLAPPPPPCNKFIQGKIPKNICTYGPFNGALSRLACGLYCPGYCKCTGTGAVTGTATCTVNSKKYNLPPITNFPCTITKTINCPGNNLYDKPDCPKGKTCTKAMPPVNKNNVTLPGTIAIPGDITLNCTIKGTGTFKLTCLSCASGSCDNGDDG